MNKRVRNNACLVCLVFISLTFVFPLFSLTVHAEEIISPPRRLGNSLEWNSNEESLYITNYHLQYNLEFKKDECIVSCIGTNTRIEPYNASFDYDVDADEWEALNAVAENLISSNRVNLIYADGTEIINSTVVNHEAMKLISVPASCMEIGNRTFHNLKNLSEVTVYSENLDLTESGLGFIHDENGNETINSNLIMKGFSGSTAESYAKENGLTFIALDEPEETTESTTETTSETTPEETTTSIVNTTSTTAVTSSTPETTTSTINTTSTTTATSSIPETTTSIVNTTSNTKTNTTVSSGTSSPKTGEGGIAAVLVTSITALLGGFVCRRKR